MPDPTVTLPSGDEMPIVGLGTWNLDDDQVYTAVDAALDAGYTHIDTAEGYMNEDASGDAITDHDREDLFLTSKVLAKNLSYESVIESCEASLDRLNTSYLDLYLIHWPNPAISVRETADAMKHLHDQGKVRNIGVSNFSAYQLSAVQHVSDLPIAVNQIEYHPRFQRTDILDYCRQTGTVLEAAAPLARTEVLDNDVVLELAEQYDRLPAQIVIRWAIEKDIVVIPKSSSPTHIAENRDVFDFELDPADHERLDEQDRTEPVYDFPARDWEDDVWGISQ